MRTDRSEILARMAGRYLPDASDVQEAGGAGVSAARKARIAFWLAANGPWIFLLMLASGILAAAAVWLYALVASLFGTEDSGRSAGSYANWVDYRSYFPAQSSSVPYGVPVESWVIGMSIDRNRYGPPDSYGLPFYKDHTGQDFSRTWKDRLAWYLPYVFATHSAVLKQTEVRTEDPSDPKWWIYTKKEFRNGAYVEIQSRIPKSKADENVLVKPYGNHVVLSSPDGTFYTLYAHLDSVRADLLTGRQAMLSRGDPIGIMGNTGNSFGVHLHYEVLDCGDNPDFKKSYRSCKKVNPLAFDPRIGDNYVGADPKKSKTVYAGTSGAKSVPVPRETLAAGVKSQYFSFCQGIGSLTSDCAATFAVAYQRRSAPTYPDITDPSERISAAKKYVGAKYGYLGSSMTFPEIAQVAAAEGIGAGTDAESMFEEVGKALSYGKYENRGRIYRKKPLASSKEQSDEESRMLSDLSADLSAKLAANGRSAEKAFSEYYRSPWYRSDAENPYVYNMSSPEKSYMQLRDRTGKPDGTYREYGALALYDMVK